MNNLKNNFKIKAFSVVFAFFMWLYVMAEVDPIIIRTMDNIQVSAITNMEEIRDDGLTIAYGQNYAVSIDFRAKRSILNEYIRNDIKPVGTIVDPKAGSNIMDISIDLPKEVEYSINPTEITVVLERSVLALKPVEVTTEGNLEKDYELTKIDLSKSSLYVEGPQSQVEKVAKLTAKINLNGYHNDFSSKTKVVPVDEKGNTVEGVYLSQDYVISEISVSKFKDVPVNVVFIDENNSIIESSSFESEGKTIRITGHEADIDAVTQVFTKPISINIFNNIDGVKYELAPIQNITMNESRVKIIPLESEMQTYDLDIPKVEISIMDVAVLPSEDADSDTNSNIEELVPEIVKVQIITGKEYESKINTDNVKLIINKEGKIEYKIKFPVRSIQITPDQITETGTSPTQ